MTVSDCVSGEFLRLLEIMARLRAPDGCPWDREQTPESLRRTFLEEAYELVEAIHSGVPDRVRDELGDLCLHIVFQARMAEEAGRFDMGDVLRGVNEKLVRRHPHVFADSSVTSPDEVVVKWDEIKAAERRENGEVRESLLDGVPREMPSLLYAEKLQRRAATVGFDWPDASGPLEKVAEEARELAESDDPEEEFGDLLFALVNFARFAGISSEVALRRASEKFDRRFREIEAAARHEGRSLEGMSLDEMDALWDLVKSREGGSA